MQYASSRGRSSEEDWEEIMREDSAHSYGDVGESASLATDDREELMVEEQTASMPDIMGELPLYDIHD